MPNNLRTPSISIYYCLYIMKFPLMVSGRDTFFYSVALILLVVFFMDNLIKWWEALILFLWYGAYVSFMKFNVPMEKKFLEMFPSLAAKDNIGFFF